MRTSKFPLSTTKETPVDAEIVSHQLMLRAGMIRKLASGLYSWLPLGLRVLKKIETIVRVEMNNSGALEVLMPAVQPAELWQESGRWQQYGPELLRFHDRHQRAFCFGPTHEEVITDLARNLLQSYKQLPVNYYQIQTKFRDERRPRFGIMRAREFIMKDAYSFHKDSDCLEKTYDVMYQTYSTIFSRCGLGFRSVVADTGAIGGSASHEFHVLAESGEDRIAFSNESDYAANVELAEAVCTDERPEASEDMRLVDTPDAKTINELVENYQQPVNRTVKTLIVHASDTTDSDLIALLIRGDHNLNELKATRLPQIKKPLMMATEDEIRNAIGAGPGSLGPVNMPLPMIIDRSVAVLADFSAGANIDDQHYFGINWERDLPVPEIADIREVSPGDPSPDGKGQLSIARGIEVGHIFQLGYKYSKAMHAQVLDEHGNNSPMIMGCYGIGVSRIVAAAIEQHHDQYGIVWPQSIAPFEVALCPINMHKSPQTRDIAEDLYTRLIEAGVDVLLDDRGLRPGNMFADIELIGIPHRIVVGKSALEQGMIEYRERQASENEMIPFDQIINLLTGKLK